MVDNLLGVFKDINEPILGLLLSETFAENKPKNIEKVKPKLDLIEKFYGEKEFALGYPTIIDFFVAEFSCHIKGLDKGLYDSYPHLARVNGGVNNLAEIKEFYEVPLNADRIFVPPNANYQPVK